jgi:2-polyprenyl-6-methoxyphenol hydroxylase-like FAD-dependent oxidoreductase
VNHASRTSEDTAILGAGPVGLATSLALVGRGGARIVTSNRPVATEVPRVDMVPATFLAFLLELGIHPAQLGVRELHDRRLIAWSDATPEAVRGAAVAHVERPALELAMLAALERMSTRAVIFKSFSDPANLAERVIDATGRRAVTATRVHGPDEPWIARVFSRRGEFDRAGQAFRMAALPAGYAYRLASPRLLAVGVIVSKSAAAMTPSDIEKYLRDSGADWLLHDIGSLERFHGGKGGVASVQWSTGPTGTPRIGDAALARDSLSAQGLASGIADAVAMVRGAGKINWPDRIREQRVRHLKYLTRLLRRSRFRAEPPWVAYQGFLARETQLLADKWVPNQFFADATDTFCDLHQI